ncbi:uncharacterized protein PV09_01779 [Verruconis gallopava]|uniref:ATP-dependent RNA helicase n=1 Tax=Verruconis gallopava TaxID=253628 RepID=A0A0D2B9D9_9PEZI|nr:uncharacterized protein PV09_01779 [Verruconis gallopava]KIW07864.1 hypothetical protein PV09_01779 [Verruconis gallopava]
MLGALRRYSAFVPRTLSSAATRASAPRTQALNLNRLAQLKSCVPARSFSNAIRWQQQALAEAVQETEAPAGDGFTKFQELADRQLVHQNVIDAIKRMGIETMTEVQAATINTALRGTDIIAQAKTGTGKTIAFLLPILQRILENDPSLATRSGWRQTTASDIRALIISPTRELAEQIADEARKLCRGTNVIVQAAVGGTMKSQMLRATQRQGCHLLVGTPGRLRDILSDPWSGVAAPGLDALVLDEADRLMDDGFWPSIQDIMGMLPNPKDKDRQTLMFSATMPREVLHVARQVLKPGYEFVSTIREDDAPTLERVPQKVVRADGFENLMPALYELAMRETRKAEEVPDARPFKAIVFFNSTAETSLATAIFNNLRSSSRNGRAFLSRTPVLEIHGKLTQAQRTRASADFKRLPGAMLFSSDVTARGMDFPNVTHVIQVGCPSNAETYIHRIGRTARAGKEGEGWLFLSKVELPEARQRLRGLPIQPDDTLQSANVNMTTPAQLPAPVAGVLTDVGNAVKSVDPSLLSATYRAYLGVYQWLPTKQLLVDSLARLSRFGWGLSSPPKVPPGLASKLRLNGLQNVNIGVEETSLRSGGRLQGLRSGGSHRSGGGNGRQGWGNDNPAW